MTTSSVDVHPPRTAAGSSWPLLFRNQLLGFLREPAAAVFNLALPIFIVLVQGVAFGDEPLPDVADLRVVDVLPVSAAVIFIMILGVFGVGIGLSSMIESRSLATYRFFPGGVKSVVSAYWSVLSLLIVVGIAISVGMAVAIWDVPLTANWAEFAIGVVVGSVAFLGAGTVIAGMVASSRSAQGVASGLFFPLLFLSGAVFPIEQFPAQLQTIAVALPGHHLYQVLGTAWLPATSSFAWASLAYLVGLAVVASLAGVWLISRREL